MFVKMHYGYSEDEMFFEKYEYVNIFSLVLFNMLYYTTLNISIQAHFFNYIFNSYLIYASNSIYKPLILVLIMFFFIFHLVKETVYKIISELSKNNTHKKQYQNFYDLIMNNSTNYNIAILKNSESNNIDYVYINNSLENLVNQNTQDFNFSNSIRECMDSFLKNSYSIESEFKRKILKDELIKLINEYTKKNKSNDSSSEEDIKIEKAEIITSRFTFIDDFLEYFISKYNEFMRNNFSHFQSIDLVKSTSQKENEVYNQNNYFQNTNLRIHLGYYKMSSIFISIFVNIFKIEDEKLILLEINDITELKKMEIEKILIEKEREKTLARAAHDLKCPLFGIISLSNSIKETAQLYMKNPDLNKFEFMNELTKRSTKVENLSNYANILLKDFIKSSTGNRNDYIKIELIDVVEILNFSFDILNTLLEMNECNKVTTSMKIDPKIYEYEYLSNDTKLKQIILNILSNSVKFTNNGSIMIEVNIKNYESKINVETNTVRFNELEFVKLLNKSINLILEINIKDTGSGLKETQINELIQKHEVKNDENCKNNKFGTGLGINIILQLAKMLNIMVEIQSKENVGTQYSLFMNIKENSLLSSRNSSNRKKNENHFSSNFNYSFKGNNKITENKKNVCNNNVYNVNDYSVTNILKLKSNKCIFKTLSENSEFFNNLIPSSKYIEMEDNNKNRQKLKSTKKFNEDIIIKSPSDPFTNKFNLEIEESFDSFDSLVDNSNSIESHDLNPSFCEKTNENVNINNDNLNTKTSKSIPSLLTKNSNETLRIIDNLKNTEFLKFKFSNKNRKINFKRRKNTMNLEVNKLRRKSKFSLRIKNKKRLSHDDLLLLYKEKNTDVITNKQSSKSNLDIKNFSNLLKQFQNDRDKKVNFPKKCNSFKNLGRVKKFFDVLINKKVNKQINKDEKILKRIFDRCLSRKTFDFKEISNNSSLEYKNPDINNHNHKFINFENNDNNFFLNKSNMEGNKNYFDDYKKNYITLNTSINETPEKNSKYKILIIDDQTFIRDNIKNLTTYALKELELDDSYEIIEGKDGIDILKFIMEDQSQGNKIKIIITDQNMRYLDGSDALLYVKKFESSNKIKNLPIFICCTADDNDENEENLLKSGFNEVLSKDCNKKKFTYCLKKYLVK